MLDVKQQKDTLESLFRISKDASPFDPTISFVFWFISVFSIIHKPL